MISEALKKYRDEARARPTREELEGIKDSIEYQLGYRLGFHHALEEAIDIAEDEEDA